MLNVEYSVEDVEDANYIIGRCGRILVNGVEIGRIGESAPRVLKNWKIRMPVVGVEMGLEFLLGIDI
jgi:phenylalanyl-tRNA synthetase beta subunit